MANYRSTKMCDQCPFRLASPRGWLGPWTVDQLEAVVHSEAEFICHKSIDVLHSKNRTDDEILARGKHCVGMLRYRNAVLKQSRDPKQAAAQDALRQIPDQPVIPAFKLREHHTPENE